LRAKAIGKGRDPGVAVLAPLQKAPQPLYSRQTIRYAAGRVSFGTARAQDAGEARRQ
jgi:hypothetical protein